MAARRVNFYLVKTVRLSGWILLPLMVLYIATGYALCGKFGFAGLLDSQQALTLHKIFDLPLVALFLVHSLAAICLALRRWRWIGTKPAA